MSSQFTNIQSPEAFDLIQPSTSVGADSGLTQKQLREKLVAEAVAKLAAEQEEPSKVEQIRRSDPRLIGLKDTVSPFERFAFGLTESFNEGDLLETAPEQIKERGEAKTAELGFEAVDPGLAEKAAFSRVGGTVDIVEPAGRFLEFIGEKIAPEDETGLQPIFGDKTDELANPTKKIDDEVIGSLVEGTNRTPTLQDVKKNFSLEGGREALGSVFKVVGGGIADIANQVGTATEAATDMKNAQDFFEKGQMWESIVAAPLYIGGVAQGLNLTGLNALEKAISNQAIKMMGAGKLGIQGKGAIEALMRMGKRAGYTEEAMMGVLSKGIGSTGMGLIAGSGNMLAGLPLSIEASLDENGNVDPGKLALNLGVDFGFAYSLTQLPFFAGSALGLSKSFLKGVKDMGKAVKRYAAGALETVQTGKKNLKAKTMEAATAGIQKQDAIIEKETIQRIQESKAKGEPKEVQKSLVEQSRAKLLDGFSEEGEVALRRLDEEQPKITEEEIRILEEDPEMAQLSRQVDELDAEVSAKEGQLLKERSRLKADVDDVKSSGTGESTSKLEKQIDRLDKQIAKLDNVRAEGRNQLFKGLARKKTDSFLEGGQFKKGEFINTKQGIGKIKSISKGGIKIETPSGTRTVSKGDVVLDDIRGVDVDIKQEVSQAIEEALDVAPGITKRLSKADSTISEAITSLERKAVDLGLQGKKGTKAFKKVNSELEALRKGQAEARGDVVPESSRSLNARAKLPETRKAIGKLDDIARENQINPAQLDTQKKQILMAEQKTLKSMRKGDIEIAKVKSEMEAQRLNDEIYELESRGEPVGTKTQDLVEAEAKTQALEKIQNEKAHRKQDLDTAKQKVSYDNVEQDFKKFREEDGKSEILQLAETQNPERIKVKRCS